MKVRNGVAYLAQNTYRKFHSKRCSFIKRRKESTFYLYFFSLLAWWSRNIVVGIVSKPRVRRFCIRIAGSSYRFSVPGRLYQLWGPPSLLLSRNPVLFPGQDVMFTTHFYLASKLLINGAVPLRPYTPSCRGDDNCNFTFHGMSGVPVQTTHAISI